MDLQKAQSACEQLSEQLMNAEAAKEKFEAEAKNFREGAELARKAKEVRIFFCISLNNWEFFFSTVQSRFSDIEFSDNLWFSDYYSKTIFQFTA